MTYLEKLKDISENNLAGNEFVMLYDTFPEIEEMFNILADNIAAFVRHYDNEDETQPWPIIYKKEIEFDPYDYDMLVVIIPRNSTLFNKCGGFKRLRLIINWIKESSRLERIARSLLRYKLLHLFSCTTDAYDETSLKRKYIGMEVVKNLDIHCDISYTTRKEIAFEFTFDQLRIIKSAFVPYDQLHQQQ